MDGPIKQLSPQWSADCDNYGPILMAPVKCFRAKRVREYLDLTRWGGRMMFLVTSL